MEKGWRVIGVDSSYGGRDYIILYHDERQILGKISYKTSELPEITE